MVTDVTESKINLDFIIEITYLLNVFVAALCKLFNLFLRTLVNHLQMCTLLLHVLQRILRRVYTEVTMSLMR